MFNYRFKRSKCNIFKFVKNSVVALILFSFLITMNSCNQKPEHVRLIKEIDRLSILNSELKEKVNSLEQNNKVSSRAFDIFLWDFMIDSVLQKESIDFPLEKVTLNTKHGGLDTSFITSKDWKHDPIYAYNSTERSQVYDNYEMLLNHSRERLVHWFGLETGGNIRYYFKFTDRWKLIKIENFGT